MARQMQSNFSKENIVIYDKGEFFNSTGGENSIIGEFSRIRNCQIGHHVRIDRNNFLLNVKLGDYSYTGPFDMMFYSDIGKFVSISYGVTIGPPEHNYNRLSSHPMIYDKFYGIFEENTKIRDEKFKKTVSIGNDVWIGCNATILRGVKIGDGVVVGANSLVNKDVPPYAIVAGCPARIIKYRFDENIIKQLLKLRWWSWDIEKIRNNRWVFEQKLTLDIIEQIKMD